MSTQYADENIKQESIGGVSDCENMSEGRPYGEGSDAILSSDDGIRYKFPSPPPKPMVQLNSPVNLAVPRFKITSRRTTLATQYVPVSEMRERGDNKAGASGKLVAIIPKKRRYVDTVAESNFEAIEVSRETVKSAIDAPTIKKERQHVKKRHRKSNSIDKTPREKRHKDGKKQSKKVSAWLPTNEEPSTSFGSNIKVECVKVLPLADGPPSSKVPSLKTIKANRFWTETLASDFDSREYEMLLKQSRFTEEQADVIKQSFHLLCRKLHIASTYTDRFMKTHMCIDCNFSISHQCVSVHFSQFVRSNGNVMSTTSITPESMNICICGFAFFHSHAKNSRTKLSDNLSSMNISRLFEHERSLNMSCPSCHMNIVMKNRNDDVCSDLTNWVDLYGTQNRQFYEFIKDRLELSSMHKPSLKELFTCKRRCCQIFHRCPENAAPCGDNVTPLSPVTTYTRTVVTRSND